MLSKQSANNVIDSLNITYEDWRVSRMGLEQTWHTAWSEFISTPEALDWLKSVGLHKKVEIEVDECDKFTDDYWRHKINTGKGFELVETLWAYFMRATFSTDDWFSVVVHDLQDRESAIMVRNILKYEMDISNFRKQFGDFLRQMLVTGTSTMKVDWCNTRKHLVFTPIACTSVYLNPVQPVEEAAHMVTTTTNRRALGRMLSKYNMLDEKKLKKMRGIDNPVEEVQSDSRRALTGLFTNNDRSGEPFVPSSTDRFQLIEYYGPMYDDMEYLGGNCYAVFSGTDLLHFEKDKRSPYITSNFITMLGQAWGLSPLSASSGLIVADRLFLNKRLDALEATINNAYMVTEGMLADEDFKIFPGAKIPVLEGEATPIVPLATASSNLPLTYQEEQFLGSRIDRNVGTIPTVGGGQVRQAERVTASEINAAKAVGGTRLNEYHTNLERTATNRMLQMAYYTLQKHGKVTRKMVSTDTAGFERSIEYDACSACSLELEFKIRASEAILTNDNEASKLLEFVQMASAVPQMAEKVNWDYIITRLAELQGFRNPDLVLNQPAQNEASQELPLTQPEQAAMQAQMAVDGGASMAEDLQQRLSL